MNLAFWQVPITASLYFTSNTSIHILKLRLANFDPASVKWDEGGPGSTENGCPHLYGNFGAEDVVDVREFVRKEGEGWREVLERERWLE
jgi:uncharacterized protein (DUF952 family)